MDFDGLAKELRRKLRERPGEWLTFSELADQICADRSMVSVLIAIANSDATMVVFQEKSVKLKLDDSEAVPGPPPPTQSHRIASQAVRDYFSQLEPVVLKVTVVRLGVRVLDRFVHAIEIVDSDDDLRITDDTPVEFKSHGAKTTYGRVATVSRNGTIFVALEFEIMQSDLPAVLIVHKKKLWVDLAEGLDKLDRVPERGQSLFDPPQPGGKQEPDSFLAAFHMPDIPIPWTRLLWGPPSAGKTYGLGRLSNLLLRYGATDERILIVAPSNVAVDVAALHAVDALSTTEEGKALIRNRRILRYGYPREATILNRSELLGPADLEDLSNEIDRCFADLRKLKEKRAPDAEIAAMQSQVRQLAERRKQKVQAHIAGCKLVATTIAGLVSANCPILTSGPWHTVIIDEASMVSGASVLFISSLAERRLLLAGDPRQLGPVFEWNRGTDGPPLSIRKWIAQDPYELAGLSVGIGAEKVVSTADSRLISITEQRRCHPRLWSFISRYYPNIKTTVNTAQLNSLAELPPVSGEPMVLLDVSSGRSPSQIDFDKDDLLAVGSRFESACLKVGRSWQNPSTAMIAIDVARDVKLSRPEAKVAIITPYRGQAQLIRRLLDDESRAADSAGPHRVPMDGIDVGTVHTFQGSEADVVVFDMVDGPPRPSLGILHRGDSGMRLTNVAITRARGKLILIAHKDWLKSKTSREQAPLLWDLVFGEDASAPCPVLPPREHSSRQNFNNDGTESPIEKILFEEMQRRQADLPPFCLQYRIVNESGRIVSRADFAFVAQRVAVYCDGALFHLPKTQWQRDIRQRRELAKLGWGHLVFSGSEILKGAGADCVNEIIDFFRNR
jgi:very-short-patch-repair endonuclease